MGSRFSSFPGAAAAFLASLAGSRDGDETEMRYLIDGAKPLKGWGTGQNMFELGVLNF